MLNGLRNRAARFLQRPGTADLKPYLELLPDVAKRERAVAALAELAAAARQAADTADDAMLSLDEARMADLVIAATGDASAIEPYRHRRPHGR